MRSLKRAVLVLCLLAWTLPIFGQDHRAFQDELAGIQERARWRLGPLLIFPALQIQDVGYDDNVYLESPQEGPVSDYRATLSPQIKFNVVLGGSLLLSFLENPEYLYYNREKSRRAFGNSITPGFRVLLLRRFVLSGNYDYQKHFRSLSREVNLLTENISKGYHGEIFFETPRMTSLGVSADIRQYAHENLDLQGSLNGLAKELNREERSAHAELNYSLSPVRLFFLKAGYTEYRFKSAVASWRDAYSWQASAGIRFSPASRIQGLLSLGYKELHPRQSGLRTFSGIFGNTELNMRLGRIMLRVLYSRDPMFSYWSGIFYFVDHRYGGGLSFYLSQFVRLDYSFFQNRLNYPDPIPYRDSTGVRDIERNDRGNLHSVGLMFRLFRTTGLGISANYADRSSSYPGVIFRRFFIGGYLSYEF